MLTKRCSAVIGGIACVALLLVTIAAAAPDGEAPRGEQWMYKTVFNGSLYEKDGPMPMNMEDVAKKLESEINGYGAAGWELCTVRRGVMIFKRPK